MVILSTLKIPCSLLPYSLYPIQCIRTLALLVKSAMELQIHALCKNFQETVDMFRRINRGSYISDHVLLNLFNELGKRDIMQECEACRELYHFFATGLINS